MSLWVKDKLQSDQKGCSSDVQERQERKWPLARSLGTNRENLERGNMKVAAEDICTGLLAKSEALILYQRLPTSFEGVDE